ncbi:MAG: hypothetical protein AAGF33_00285 [Pseudomonadota bacterium]
MTEANLRKKRIELRHRMNLQFDQARQARQTLLITSEGLSTPVTEEIAALKNWLSDFFDEITIVYVLRRQDLRSIGLYKNNIKNNGATDQNCLLKRRPMHYYAELRKWVAYFGRANVCPILFPDSVPEARDLIQDYCDIAGIKGVYDPVEADHFKRNTTLDGRAIELLRQLNELSGPKQSSKTEIAKRRRFLERLLTAEFRSNPQRIQPARKDVEAFYDRYRAGNEAIRAMFFPDRATLFDEDFSKYPDTAHYPQPDAEFVLRLCRAIERSPA